MLMNLPPNRAVILRNTRCLYCGTPMERDEQTRDHVIGRRFVPKGKLAANWNLIVNACRKCNNAKSSLEDDIAAITLQPDLWGRYGHEDAAAIEEARHRAEKSISRRTRKPVGQSEETVTLKSELGPGVSFSFNFTSPPQIEEDRAFELARLHLMALFYMQSYNPETRQGGYWLHGFHPVLAVRREDWGNPIMRDFTAATADWEWRLHAVTADGFFKALTRLHPNGTTWAWAIEWNHSMRLIGFFGELGPAQTLADTFARPQIHTVHEAPGEMLRYARETPLLEADDTLFTPPPEAEYAAVSEQGEPAKEPVAGS